MRQGRDDLKDLLKQARDENITPDALVDLVQKLAAYAAWCAQEEAAAHAAYLDAERKRKSTFAMKKLEAMAGGATATKAEAMAEGATEKERKAEIAAQATRLELKALLDGARDVMDAARSKLSWLKLERNHTNA